MPPHPFTLPTPLAPFFETFLNLADAHAQLGGLAAAAGDTGAAAAAFSTAFDTYARACALSSSDQGDDLPGLLVNWGGALHEAAGAMGRADLLDAAASRLREAAAFGRGDPTPLCALGDVLVDAASSAATSAGGLPGADPASAALLAEAADDGYCAALALDRRAADAHAGLADVRLTQCRATAAGEKVAGVGREGSRRRPPYADRATHRLPLLQPVTPPRQPPWRPPPWHPTPGPCPTPPTWAAGPLAAARATIWPAPLRAPGGAPTRGPCWPPF